MKFVQSLGGAKDWSRQISLIEAISRLNTVVWNDGNTGVFGGLLYLGTEGTLWVAFAPLILLLKEWYYSSTQTSPNSGAFSLSESLLKHRILAKAGIFTSSDVLPS